MKLQKRSKDFDRMIVEAIKENLSFFAWQSIAGVVEKCELKVKAYRKDYNEIVLELCSGQEEKIGRLFSGSRILNVYVPELSVSFTSELKSVTEDKKVKLYPPSDYAFFERRKHKRIRPSKACHVSFIHEKIIIKKIIYDFSLGGIAIVVPKSAKMIITKGKIFDVFVLDFGIRKIKVKAECVNSVTIDRFKIDDLPYGGFKLAFRFIEIAKEDKAFITDFVTNEIIMDQIQKKAN